MFQLHIYLVLTSAIAVASLAAEQFTGKVVAITDGDTVKVMRAGAAVRVRLYGVDTPERKQPFIVVPRFQTRQ